jgi:hypothetical protein
MLAVEVVGGKGLKILKSRTLFLLDNAFLLDCRA